MSTPHTLGRAFTTLLLGLWCTAALAGTGTDGADNYLIITPPAYAGTPPLQQFTAAKSAQGYNVATYNVPAGTTKETIRSYIASLWGTQNAPDFILIVGDTSGTATSSVNGIPHWVGQGSKHACTDHYYACMGTGDDWYPDICIGRFAVASEAQLQTVVTKSLYVESGSYPNPDYPRRIAFLANSDTYNTAEPTAEYIISTWLEPRDYIPIRIYQAQGGGTTEVRNAINTGCVMVTYMGHSSSSGWWGPRFYQEDVRALSNANLYPLAFGWSCNTSNFETGECFGETFIREANKGAAAYISASNYIYWGSVEAWRPSGILQKAFFRSFFEDNLWRIGPAWQLALYRFLDEYGLPQYPGGPPTQNQDIIRNFFEEFVLLGDPALRLPQPNGFAVNGTPAMQYVCSPPATTAEYTVQVDRHGSFAEPVTLSAADLPPGATAAFVPNGLVPPYTSIMTVSGLAGQVGDYSLTITGTAGAATQSTAVGLKVASALPAQVSLLSPPNNAQQVARQPALSWSPAAQAAEYAVELAATSNFTQLVFSATVTGESVAVTTMLEPEHDYFWRVRARNGCGDGPWSAVFMFTTLAQRDYFTESFGSGFDLANRTLRFIPEATGNYYRACTTPAAGLPTDPNGGTTLSFTPNNDDGYATVALSGRSVTFQGQSYTRFYVGTNGYITFNTGDSGLEETLDHHFAQPRISALLRDFDPGAGGSVTCKQLPDRIAVTWWRVPEWNVANINTFQIEMLNNGELRITWLAMAATHGISGLSPGGGIPPDFMASDLSGYAACGEPGACCFGAQCQVMLAVECDIAGGRFIGAGTSCTPNPCAAYDWGCVIISEVVQGTESGGCPRWIEITNTGSQDFVFLEGGLIVQTADSNDVVVDVHLGGVLIPAGTSYVINSNAANACTGAFQAIYGRPADLDTNFEFGFGNERFILTDTDDGSHLIDIYGEFGVNGTGRPWEFTDGFSFRKPGWSCADGRNFSAEEWHFGGVGSLRGPDPTGLLLANTTPGAHAFTYPCLPLHPGDMNCDGAVTFDDINPFVLALQGGQAGYEAVFPQCRWWNADCNRDGRVNFDDINPFVALFGS